MQEPTLPRYSTIPRGPPHYSAVIPSQVHDSSSFPLKNSKGFTWASVNLQKEYRGAPHGTGTNEVPIIVEGAGPVTGSVNLDLQSPETVQAISIAVRGRAITGANEGGSFTFLNHTVSLWAKEQGDPQAYRIDRVADGSVNNATNPSKSGKLCGKYKFPFSITLPKNDGLGDSLHSLPETFQERLSGVRVRYELVLKIARGRLKPDTKLQIPVVYRRRTAPEPASELRQFAYQENTVAPGPALDPNGWLTVSSVDCIGRLLNSRTVILRCTASYMYLSLHMSPADISQLAVAGETGISVSFEISFFTKSVSVQLAYTRGSFIPCHLRIESIDDQALDLLASPRTTTLRLSRRVKYLFDAGQGMQHNGKSTASKLKFEISDVGQATWSHDNDANEDDSRVRCLTGEIPLSKELPPSSDISSFGIEYTVVLHPFESVTFAPERAVPLQAHKVEVTTDFGQGPAPQAASRRARVSLIEPSWTPLAREDANAIAASHSNPFQLVT
ncbi:hypothetical protein F5880DRAFT_1608134 [Lentinula raphanica]|nr:hypothetical protein F5880DRAFT_1608134 [Lentinula raphanica]